MRTVTFSHPFREAAGLADSGLVGALYHVGLAGRGYFLDLESGRLRVETLPAVREQTDDNDEAGPGSLATQDLWRKQARSWHEGAGQTKGDETGSLPYRFSTSKGVDVWTKWRLALLPNTTVAVASAQVTQTVCVAGGKAYHQAGDTIRVSSDAGVTWTVLCTLSNQPTSQMVTDGVDLYVATSSAILKVTAAGVESVAFALNSASVVGFSKGRLWAGVGQDLYWMTPSSPAPTLAASGPWGGGSWVWTAITDGRRGTYVAGYAGDRSHVYRVPLADDGTLDAAVEAWTAPDGEVIYALTSYLGYVMLGTTLGVRFSLVDDAGDLTPGSYIPTSKAVQCFEPQDRFVWFGWSDFDGTSTGLGRVDLSVFSGPLTPAYASDLMANGAGAVTSIVSVGDKRLFTVAGQGLIAATTGRVPTGTLTGSDWTFGLDDEKLVTALDVSHLPLDGTVQLKLVTDGSTSGVLAESNRTGTSGFDRPYPINPVQASAIGMAVTLTVGTGTGPVVTGWKLLARPLPPQTMRIVLPVLLAEQHDAQGVQVHADPFDEFIFLRDLWRAGAPVTLQWGAESLTVFPANFEWIPYRQTLDNTGWTGTCVVELREVTQWA
jgi:hypothetical protein